MRPILRSSLRLKCGKVYFTLKRYGEWLFGGVKFARQRTEHKLSYPVFQHQTPLLRKLKDVDMWLQHNKIINLKIAVQNILICALGTRQSNHINCLSM